MGSSCGHQAHSGGIGVRFFLGCIRLYQRGISPWLPPMCRFEPSCSEFGIEALTRHGVWRGIYWTIGRLLRCHPFCRGGYDPVPACRHDRQHHD
ncbi:MAG: membrane protein insertion efficiency factor YidD [Planctomycetota bacterium]|nr:membrane protein insertion efficiency factor YidD [Planctomycetota bacterium]